MRSKLRSSEHCSPPLTFFLIVSPMGFAPVRLIYQKIIFCNVFIPMEEATLTMLRRGFSEAVCSSKFVSEFPSPSFSYSLTRKLIQTFSCVFISPSSSESFVEVDENGGRQEKAAHLLRFPKEGYEKECRKHSSDGRSSYSSIHCIRCRFGESIGFP